MTHTVKAISGLAIEERCEGKGMPILFLHGDSCRASQWHLVMDQIGAQAPSATFDFRGHGGSAPATDRDYGFASRAQDITTVVEALGWRRFLIAAHSGGCGAALSFLGKRSAHDAALLMVEPPSDPSFVPTDVKQKMLHDLAGPHGLRIQREFYTSIAGSQEPTRATVLRDLEAVVPDARIGTARALFAWDARSALNALNHQAAFLLAQSGDTPAGLHRLRPDIPNSIVAGDGHWPQLDRPTAVAEAILSFRCRLE